jgi:hypothetical protein
MKLFHSIIALLFLVSTACTNSNTEPRTIEDFNHDWKFQLIDNEKASEVTFDDSNWKTLSVPHDWSIEAGYQKENTAASTGFVPGGIGWYRKTFQLKQEDKNKYINIKFDGVYNNSSVWVNGHFLGFRPNGYSSFSYELSKHLKFDGSDNIIAVKVNHSAYVDSRWYTGSGIYRKVTLTKTSKIHIAQWGVQITTPKISKESAEVSVKTLLENTSKNELNNVTVNFSIFNQNGEKVSEQKENLASNETELSTIITLKAPELWSLENAHLYTLDVSVFQNGNKIDHVAESFGIRTIKFDADKGFFLNGKSVKIKGVNLHHDAGAVGSAVPKAIWEYRIKKLKSIGVNAVRFAHNPHAKELLEVCDHEGILVMNEAFDEWNVPKKKSQVYLGDNAASKEASKAYPEYFDEWGERDLKDLIRRDFNHPSVFMWSIGNEIEWTFPHYSKTYRDVNGATGAQGYTQEPIYDHKIVKKALDKNISGEDPLAKIAKQLVSWAKEEDTSRPITCGSVLPSIGMASGYGTAVDVFGYNYRAADYDAAHKEYPELKILGSENWGNYAEWKSINEREFVSGIFVWTGFAYMGEAGPWPRKGLNLSFFDFAGNKTPRGHFYETLWVATPKVYMVTTPASESEFSFKKKEGWKFEMQLTPPPVWKMLRKWEWYKVNPKWKYKSNEAIVVQTYTNCEEAELFLNGKSLGKQKLSDVIETDHILKWLVPYSDGELKVIGYNKGKKVDEYTLNTHQTEVAKIDISATKTTLTADGYDVSVVKIQLEDKNGTPIVDADKEVTFSVSGPGRNIGIDNGWEKNVQSHKSNKITTHKGIALIYLQSTDTAGTIEISVNAKNIKSRIVSINTK